MVTKLNTDTKETNSDTSTTIYYRPDKEINGYLNKRIGNDAGYDIYATQDMWFLPFQTKIIPTNSHIHIPYGHFGRVTSRSGHAKRGWLTHAGTVDRGYTGNIGVIQTNLSLLPRRIRKGERIGQIIFIPFKTVELKEVESLQEFGQYVVKDSGSDRGTKSYNSSGRY